MKRIMVLVGMVCIGSAVYAQNTALTGELRTDFDGIAPILGLELNVSSLDVIAGIGVRYYKNEASYANYEIFNTDNTINHNYFFINLGIAPKAAVNDKIALSFPLLVKMHYNTYSRDYKLSSVYIPDGLKKGYYFGFGFDAGARIYYALTPRWSIFTGALAQILLHTNNRYIYWKENPAETYKRENIANGWFDNGYMELGIRLTL